MLYTFVKFGAENSLGKAGHGAYIDFDVYGESGDGKIETFSVTPSRLETCPEISLSLHIILGFPALSRYSWAHQISVPACWALSRSKVHEFVPKTQAVNLRKVG